MSAPSSKIFPPARSLPRRASDPGRPPFEPFYIYILLLFLSFLTADTVITALRDLMLPQSAPSSQARREKFPQRKSKGEYRSITKRNIFNADGEIPPALARDGEREDDNAPPVPSQLPLNLVGTIVHFDKARSVATVQNRSRNRVQSYKIDYEIDGLARVLEIQRKRIIFRNLNNNRKEYIEIKDDTQLLSFNAPQKKGPEGEVKRQGNNFSIKRSDVLKHTNNLPQLLQQARAVPYIAPGSGGQVEGFRILDMQKGSIFTQLGFQKLDIIKEVNGEPVDSPAKAMELYNALKSSDRIDISVERNGRVEQFNYSIE